jgi:hypothetical protein
MIHTAHLTHAYRQAPWRIHRQWAGAFLLGLLALTMVSALYLDVTSRAGIAGREIQGFRAEITATQRLNADLETKLAGLLSTRAMEARARELGYRPAEAGEIHYLIVPGYVRVQAVSLGATQPQAASGRVAPTQYAQSLLEWFVEYLSNPAHGVAGVLP